jgi:phage shock protein A
MTLYARLKQLLRVRTPVPPAQPHSPLEIVDTEIALCQSRIEDGCAVLKALERRAMEAVHTGHDETARRVLAEINSVQAHMLAEEAALREFKAQRAHLSAALAR